MLTGKHRSMDALYSNLLSILAVAGSVTAVIIGWRKGGAEQGKIKADTVQVSAITAQTYAQMATDMADKYRKLDARFDVLSENIDTVNNYVGQLLYGIDILSAQISATGKPAWTPPPKPKLRDTGELKPK